MKIIIIGAGISGLSTYLFLLKHLPNPSSHRIIIVEAYDTTKLPSNASNSASILTSSNKASNGEYSDTNPTTVVGSALGLSSNGLAVLRRIDADGSTKTLDNIMSKGHEVSKWSINAAPGWELASISLGVPANEKRRGSDGKDSKGDGIEPGLMIIRHRLWECLRDAVVEAGGEIVTQRAITVVVDEERKEGDGGVVTVTFADGTTDSADLVIGADGLKSVVRKVMFEHEKEKNGKDYITPHYEGLCGIGGWLPATVLEPTHLKPGVMQLTFGSHGFFGCGYMSTPASADSSAPALAGWWSTYPSPAPSSSSAASFDRSATIAALAARHKSWKVPTIRAILAYIETHKDAPGLLDTVYPTYTTPPLPTYFAHGGALLLIGDSAHTLQPSSGQGACQALEDAEAYARLLGHYLSHPSPPSPSSSPSPSPAPGPSKDPRARALATAAATYTALRRPRLTAIYERSQKMGGMKKTMNIFQEYLVYFFVWLMTFFHDTYNAKLMAYDVPTEVDKIIKAGDKALN